MLSDCGVSYLLCCVAFACGYGVNLGGFCTQSIIESVKWCCVSAGVFVSAQRSLVSTVVQESVQSYIFC